MDITGGSDPTTQLSVNWTAGVGNAATVIYKILLVTDGTDGTEIDKDTATSHSFDNLVPGQRYNVKVRVVTADGSQTSTATSSVSDVYTSKCGLKAYLTNY